MADTKKASDDIKTDNVIEQALEEPTVSSAEERRKATAMDSLRRRINAYSQLAARPSRKRR